MNEKTVRFESADGSVSEVEGRVIDIAISDTGEVVSIFFTDEHASYWLSNAPPAAQISDSVA